MITSCKRLLFLLFSLISVALYGQKIDVDGHKKNVVILGYGNPQNPILVGTGFVVQIDDVFHLVTAKHVVTEKGPYGQLTNKFVDSNLYAFYFSTSGGVTYRKVIDTSLKNKIGWITHQNIAVDIAIIPFGIDSVKDDLRVIPQNYFLDTKRLYETYDVYFVSFHPGLVSLNDFSPIFRSGNISRINKDKTILLDAFAFPGNSGSPVFLKSSPIRFDSNVTFQFGDELGDKFIGIVGSYIPYEDIAVSTQTSQPRVIFQENSGIAFVWSIEFINQVINSSAMKQQIQYIKQNFK